MKANKFTRSLLSLALIFSMIVPFVTVAFAKDKGYDPKVDYSIEIAKAAAEGKDTSALEAAREAKINDMYGGTEPPLAGSNGTTTFSQVFNGSGKGGSDYGSSDSYYSGNYSYGGGVSTPDVSLNAGQCQAIMDSLAALGRSSNSGGGGISWDDNSTVVNAITSAGSKNGSSASNDTVAKAQEILCKIYDNDATAFNKSVADSIINGTPQSVTTVRDDGLVEMWEGGHLFLIDKSGDHWVVTEDKDNAQPNAVALTKDQINQIFALKEEFEHCQLTGDVDEFTRIHQQTEDLRNQIGYTGGTFGDMYGGIRTSTGSSWSETTSDPTPVNTYTPSVPTSTPLEKHDYYVVFTAVKGESHGAISPSPSATVAAGGSQVIRVTPDSGYVVKSMIVGPDADNLYDVGSRTSYTIDNIQQDFFVFVEFCSAAKINGASAIVVGPDGTTGAAAGRTPEMKSGYGISPVITSISTENAIVDSITAYNSATGKTYKMQLVNGKWVLPVNSSSKSGARVDYLPANLADGTYKWKITITAHNKDNSKDICEPYSFETAYKIKGSMYEEDFTGGRR